MCLILSTSVGQGPTDSIYRRQDAARKDWRVTQGLDAHPLPAGQYRELPLFPEAIAWAEEGGRKEKY